MISASLQSYRRDLSGTHFLEPGTQNAVDAIMPNGRTLQIASYHHYRDQWARAFDITYEGADGSQSNCHQTTFGMSERLLGAVVGVHGDDAGLIMPPSIAPIQVVVMPVAAHLDEAVEPQASTIVERLKKSGIRARLDSRDMRPGAKHYDWEIKGVPLRIEIGPRDLSSDSFVMTLRTGGKASHPLDLLEDTVLRSLEDVSTELRSSIFKSDGVQDVCPPFTASETLRFR